MSSVPEQSERLAQAFLRACRLELQALKPGNVHVYADGHSMTVNDFLRAAEAAAPCLCSSGAPVGWRIRTAIEASWEAAPMNTNLGIVLLAAPLIAAAEHGTGDLRAGLRAILESLTVEDASEAFAAILRANPAGLGRAPEQDVTAPPTMTLLEAMRLAEDVDLVARQYATAYEDVFAIGVARLQAAIGAERRREWQTTLVFLDFLSTFPDSHIARKYGPDTAELVRLEAESLRRSLPAKSREAFPALLAFDRDLKQRRLNPGTSADLTVASLLAFEVELITRGRA
jgi:triphosphoribosyl-dephospho-CoA synthase